MTTSVTAHGNPEPVTAEPQLQATPAEPPSQVAADLAGEVNHEAHVAEQLDQPEDPAYPDGAVAVSLEGAGGRRGVIHVLDLDEWPSDANSALQVGDMESWAEGCLAGNDYEDVWCDLSPTIGHIKAMFAEYRRLTGSDTGKSFAAPRSLRRAARRSK